VARLASELCSVVQEVKMGLRRQINPERFSSVAVDLPVAAALVGLDVFMRVVPHAWHFTPVIASALFAAAVFRVGALSLAVPLVALGISDWLMGFYNWQVMIVVYAASMLPAVLMLIVGRLRSPVILVALAAGSSLVFFLATNFAVWAFDALYTRDLMGLSACYLAALPFFKNTVAGDLFWTCVLFGGRELLRALPPMRRVSA
jgi:hypothetical protein